MVSNNINFGGILRFEWKFDFQCNFYIWYWYEISFRFGWFRILDLETHILNYFFKLIKND
jgi:hypothetical protein